MTISTIDVRELPEQHTAVVRRRIPMSQVGRIPEWIGQTMKAVERAGQTPLGAPFLRSFAMEADTLDFEVGWPVSAPFAGDGDVRASTLPGGPAAVASYFGPYDEIAPVYEAIQRWCAEQGREIAGPPWESYLTDPHEEPDPTRWRTDVYFPLKR